MKEMEGRAKVKDQGLLPQKQYLMDFLLRLFRHLSLDIGKKGESFVAVLLIKRDTDQKRRTRT